MLDDLLCNLPVLVDVELKPLDLVTLLGVDDLVKRARCKCWDHLNYIVLVSAAGKDNLALWVTELAERGSRYVEWDGALCTEHGGGHVDVLYIVKDTWAEPDLVECRMVLAHGLRLC